MGLHPVVAVVGAQLQEFRQILVPGVQIHRRRPLPDAQLVHRHGGVVDQLDPADHAAGGPLKAPDAAAGGPDLAEIQPHAAAELADLGEVIHTAVDALQAVGHRVDKAAGELMIGLAGVGESGCGHGDLKAAEDLIELAHPAKPVVGLVHGQMEGDPQKHLLGRLQGLMAAVLDHIPLQQKVQARPGELPVPAVVQKGGGLLQLPAGVGLEDVLAVEPLPDQIDQLLIKAPDPQPLQPGRQLAAEAMIQKAGRHDLPGRRLRAGQLHRRLGQRG